MAMEYLGPQVIALGVVGRPSGQDDVEVIPCPGVLNEVALDGLVEGEVNHVALGPAEMFCGEHAGHLAEHWAQKHSTLMSFVKILGCPGVVDVSSIDWWVASN
jgi:hypothetical protein